MPLWFPVILTWRPQCDTIR